MFNCVLTIISLTLAVMTIADNESPKVITKQGVLLGKLRTSFKGRTFYSFTGIPYAKPPVGELRFEPPQPADPWDGVFDATKSHSICPQVDVLSEKKGIIGDEDCLYLNVYAPQLKESEKRALPVMFYIHGGGWFMGSARDDLYGPEYLLDKDIILVTANYRLGPLGFFTTGDKLVPGNTGLKDLSFVINWLKDNIEVFGGDPKSITVFGHSAGAAAAEYQMISPLNKGLIKGVISQSGSVFSIWSLSPIQVMAIRSKTLSGVAGCSTFKNTEMVKCLKGVSAYDIINATTVFMENGNPFSWMYFKPVIEPDLEGAFLSKDPLDIISSGEASEVPFMIGLTSNDGSMTAAGIFLAPELLNRLNQEFNEVAPDLFGYRETVILKNRNKVSESIKEYYFQDKPIDKSTKNDLENVFTDVLFLEGADISVNMHTKYSKAPVYQYLFDYQGSRSYCDIFHGGEPYNYGVCHGDDTIYLLKSEQMLPNHILNESEKTMMELMTTLWTNFAIYGNPTPNTDTSISVKWEPTLPNRRNFYHIKADLTTEMSENLYADRAQFWRNLPVDSRRTRVKDEL